MKNLSNVHALPDKQFLDEISCFKKAKHKNIVRFLGYCSDTQGELLELDGRDIMAEVQKKSLCFEYVPNGNIQDYLLQGMEDLHLISPSVLPIKISATSYVYKVFLSKAGPNKYVYF